jgi:hypothetical protein
MSVVLLPRSLPSAACLRLQRQLPWLMSGRSAAHRPLVAELAGSDVL